MQIEDVNYPLQLLFILILAMVTLAWKVKRAIAESNGKEKVAANQKVEPVEGIDFLKF